LRSTERNFIALVIVAVLAACGGGGGGSSPSSLTPQSTATTPSSGSGTTGTATAAPSSLPAGYLRASFSITVPKTTTGSAIRRSQTIGSGTTSITFTLEQASGTSTSSSPQTFALTTAQSYCTSGTNGLTCTLGVSAPIGLDVFLAQTFDSNGNLTGSGAVQLDVAVNATNTATLSLTSQVQSVYLTSSTPYLGAPNSFAYGGAHLRAPAVTKRHSSSLANSGNATQMRIFVIALDSAGNTILNPSIYSSPISLQMVLTDFYLDPLSSPISDVILQASYGSVDANSSCAGSGESTNAQYGTIQICSPADVVTANYVNAVGGAQGVFIIGQVGSTGFFNPTPGPNASPVPLPNSTPDNVGFIEVPVTAPLAPSGTIGVTDYNGNSITSVTSLALGTTTLPYQDYYGYNYGYNTVYIAESSFSGNFSVTSTCGSAVTLALTNNGGGSASMVITTNAASTCTATLSDGTNTVSFPITTTLTTVTGS
jgi:hypothetical protein